MYWSPNFFAVVFKKQDISQQVVTRMQDLASEFSKNFPGGGDDPSRTQHPARLLAQSLVTLNFSAVVVPLAYSQDPYTDFTVNTSNDVFWVSKTKCYISTTFYP